MMDHIVLINSAFLSHFLENSCIMSVLRPGMFKCNASEREVNCLSKLQG